MLGILIAAWSVLIWPFVFRISATVGTDCLLTGYVKIKTIGAEIKLDWKLVHTENGPDFVLRLSNNRQSSMKSMKVSRDVSSIISGAFRNSTILHKNLARYVSQIHIQTDIRLGLSDAAATAIGCATLAAMIGCFPNIKGRVVPDFQSELFCAEVRCIASFQLGKLLLSAVIFLQAMMQQLIRRKSGGAFHG